MREFVHVRDWSPDASVGENVAIVADGSVLLGYDMDLKDVPAVEALPVTLVAVNTASGFKVRVGFKMYWGSKRQNEQVILAQGVRVHNEGIARACFPMFKDVKFDAG